jgi:uracil-DNA glycosylase
MGTIVDRGYVDEPFATIVAECPGEDVYPVRDFRVEWGPIFHRGRLDGSARVLVIGQDPGTHETIVRRILVGEAGQRLQGFLAKLGLARSYVMINAFVYSVYGQWGGERNRNNPSIAEYRHRWLDALTAGGGITAVITLGSLAATAFEIWRQTPAGTISGLTARAIRHPTYPEGASRSGTITRAEAMRQLTADWNAALDELRPRITVPDTPMPSTRYGDTLAPADRSPIPVEDLPTGLPAWMRSLDSWAVRKGETTDEKRATLVVRIPKRERPWPPAPPPSPTEPAGPTPPQPIDDERGSLGEEKPS